ncbi:MAG: hypothetical protein COA70_08565 [Planctomycetota bacterium]|nr:MAG: hypothetical protein COA70_08565 [Planctomycetota bacterium]
MIIPPISKSEISTIPTWSIDLGQIALGACLALIGVVLTNRANTSRLKLQLEHEKALAAQARRQRGLETLFSQLNSWWLMVHNTTDILVRVDCGETNVQSYFDYMSELQSERVPNFGLIEMKLKILAPSLQERYQDFTKAKDCWDNYLNSVENSLGTASAASPVVIKGMMDEREKLDTLVKELKDEIVKLAVV